MVVVEGEDALEIFEMTMDTSDIEIIEIITLSAFANIGFLILIYIDAYKCFHYIHAQYHHHFQHTLHTCMNNHLVTIL